VKIKFWMAYSLIVILTVIVISIIIYKFETLPNRIESSAESNNSLFLEYVYEPDESNNEERIFFPSIAFVKRTHVAFIEQFNSFFEWNCCSRNCSEWLWSPPCNMRIDKIGLISNVVNLKINASLGNMGWGSPLIYQLVNKILPSHIHKTSRVSDNSGFCDFKEDEGFLRDFRNLSLFVCNSGRVSGGPSRYGGKYNSRQQSNYFAYSESDLPICQFNEFFCRLRHAPLFAQIGLFSGLGFFTVTCPLAESTAKRNPTPFAPPVTSAALRSIA